MHRFLLACLLAALAEAAPPQLFDGPYPRAFFFRGSEGVARNPNTQYGDWVATFSRLHGIMGKVFDEEIPNTAARNIDFFTRFAAQFPDQAVMLHYNGNSRDPRNAAGFFAGHWLYHDGSALTADLPADADATVLSVADASKDVYKRQGLDGPTHWTSAVGGRTLADQCGFLFDTQPSIKLILRATIDGQPVLDLSLIHIWSGRSRA